MYELDVAIRYIGLRRRQTLFSVIAVALSVALIILSMSVLGGFWNNLIESTVENQAHIVISGSGDDEYLHLYRGLEEYLEKQEGVTAVSPFFEGDAALRFRQNVEGAQLRGVLPEAEDMVMGTGKDMIAGSFISLDEPGNNIILGSKLADNLEVSPGDIVSAWSPGAAPRDFRVTGIIRTGTQADETIAYAGLGRVQEFYGRKDVITGAGVRVRDIYEAEPLAQKINRETGYDAVSWMEKSSAILNLLGTMFQFIYLFYGMIFAISGFGIVNILIMIVLEKVKDIGMLIAMGATRNSIRTIFLLEALLLGLAGVAIGLILGYASALAVAAIRIQVPPQMYFGMDHLPVVIELQNFIIAGIFSLMINLIAGLYPAHKASQLDPVEAIHSV